MQLVHFDFNSTPFEIHDDNYVLKAMKYCENRRGDATAHIPTNGGERSRMANMYQLQAPRSNMSGMLPAILKARVKYEHSFSSMELKNLTTATYRLKNERM